MSRPWTSAPGAAPRSGSPALHRRALGSAERGAPRVARRLVLTAALGTAACGSDTPAEKTLSRAELMDPQTCKRCHPAHYEEWSGSMHAYAAADPVFLAMNRRGQEETQGKLGDFCIRCHAPLAVAEGYTSDGLDLDQTPQHLLGITCYFCHDVTAVEGTHNAPLRLGAGTTLHGGLSQPIRNDAHGSAYSALHDRRSLGSATLCGACHDITIGSDLSASGQPVELERTFAEWRESLFDSEGAVGLACGRCHMSEEPNVPIADAPGVPVRRARHRHDFPGVDVALTPFPRRQEQQELVRRFLDTSLRVEVCVSQIGAISVQLENSQAGHGWPSGAAQDRRAWVELVAFDASGQQLYASGVVPDGGHVTELADPDLWLLRDRVSGVDGTPVHMFWDVASIESQALLAPVTTSPLADGFHRERVGKLFAGTRSLGQLPERVTLRVRMQPVGLDVLADLVDSGHLDAAVASSIPTFDLLPRRGQSDSTLEWTRELAYGSAGTTTEIDGIAARCLATSPQR